jgi:putative ABC transport system ATP-binding protein
MEGCRSVIKLINIEKSYNAGKLNEFHVLKGISAEIKDGELVAIVGKSGAGKSTLLHIIACIDNYDSGEYYIDDLLIKNMSEKKLANIRNEKIGIVMQDFSLVEDFTVLENVIIPLDFAKKKSKNTKEQALKALKQVKMEEYAKKRVKNLSGGEKQRVAIARAIINNPDLILADEPTGSLDSANTEAIMDLFFSLNKQGKTIIIVTHDKELAEKCHRIIEISDGRII